jgi:predicted ATPase
MEDFVTFRAVEQQPTLLQSASTTRFCYDRRTSRRTVVEEQSAAQTLPWVDAVAFLRRAIDVSLADRAAADASARWVFFDRGLIDAAAALEHLTGERVVESLGVVYRYNKRVFLAPPWPEIYTLDQERRHGLSAAVAEYNRLIDVYPSLGYDIHVLPKVSVAERANWILASLER